MKKVKFNQVADNNKLVRKLRDIGNIPDVFKKDYIEQVGALVDTFKKEGRLDTKKAQQLIDTFTPIWEATKQENEVRSQKNKFINQVIDNDLIQGFDYLTDIRKSRDKYDIDNPNSTQEARNKFINSLVENLTTEQINDVVNKKVELDLAEEAKLSGEEKIEVTDEVKEKALSAAESILDDIDYIINETDIEGLEAFEGLDAEDISKALILSNGRFNKDTFTKVNEILKNMYNGIDAGINPVLSVATAAHNFKNANSLKLGNINMKGLKEAYRGFFNSLQALSNQFNSWVNGLHSQLLIIGGNNIQKVEQIEKLVGRHDVFKKVTRDIININNKFNDFLNEVKGGVGNVFTDKADSRKQQTIARVLSQLLQIPVNLDNEAQISYVKKRISEVIKSKRVLVDWNGTNKDENEIQEIQAHNDVLSELSNIGIQISDTDIVIPFESFDEFESAVKGIDKFKKHNELLTKIVTYLKNEGYSDIMKEHSWKDYARTLDEFTNYIPFFYSTPSSIEDNGIFVEGADLQGNFASAVKQRMGLGANQYLSGNFLLGLDSIHSQSITDALYCKLNFTTDLVLNSQKSIEIFNQGATPNEAGYNQGVVIRETLKNIYSKQQNIAKNGALKTTSEPNKALDVVGKMIALKNMTALINLRLFFAQSSQYTMVFGQAIKHIIKTRTNLIQNLSPILPSKMQLSSRGRVGYMAGLGSIINEVNDLKVGNKDFVSKISNKLSLGNRVVSENVTNAAKWNTAGQDFMSRSMVFYLAIQSYAHQKGMDINSKDFWDKIEQGYVDENPDILRIVEKAKYDSDLQGNLTKSFLPELQTSTAITPRILKYTIGNLKGFSMLQQEELINRAKIAFAPNNTNSTNDRIDASIDVFTVLATNAVYGVTSATVMYGAKLLGDELWGGDILGDEDEDEDEVKKRIANLQKTERETRFVPNKNDLGFLAALSSIQSSLPQYFALDEAITYGISELGGYSSMRKAIDPVYDYIATQNEEHQGNTRYDYGSKKELMDRNIMPYQQSLVETPNVALVGDIVDFVKSSTSVMNNESLNPYAKYYYHKGVKIAAARLASHLPVVNAPFIVGNAFGLDAQLRERFKQSIVVADAIAGRDKKGVLLEGKGGILAGVGKVEGSVKNKIINKNTVETLRAVDEYEKANKVEYKGRVINPADRSILKDYKSFKK